MTTEEFVNAIDTLYKNGESMADIGRPLGVSRQNVYHWLKRTQRPSSTILRLAERVWRDPQPAEFLQVDDTTAV